MLNAENYNSANNQLNGGSSTIPTTSNIIDYVGPVDLESIPNKPLIWQDKNAVAIGIDISSPGVAILGETAKANINQFAYKSPIQCCIAADSDPKRPTHYQREVGRAIRDPFILKRKNFLMNKKANGHLKILYDFRQIGRTTGFGNRKDNAALSLPDNEMKLNKMSLSAENYLTGRGPHEYVNVRVKSDGGSGLLGDYVNNIFVEKVGQPIITYSTVVIPKKVTSSFLTDFATRSHKEHIAKNELRIIRDNNQYNGNLAYGDKIHGLVNNLLLTSTREADISNIARDLQLNGNTFVLVDSVQGKIPLHDAEDEGRGILRYLIRKQAEPIRPDPETVIGAAYRLLHQITSPPREEKPDSYNIYYVLSPATSKERIEIKSRGEQFTSSLVIPVPIRSPIIDEYGKLSVPIHVIRVSTSKTSINAIDSAFGVQSSPSPRVVNDPSEILPEKILSDAIKLRPDVMEGYKMAANRLGVKTSTLIKGGLK